MAEKWIQKAHIKKGALTKKAKARGETVAQMVANPPKNASTKTKKQIALAKTFRKMRKK